MLLRRTAKGHIGCWYVALDFNCDFCSENTDYILSRVILNADSTLHLGHYKTEVLSPQTGLFGVDAGLNMLITVDEVFDNDHRVVNQRTPNEGRFTFTAADAGQHKICFAPDYNSGGGWLSGSSPTVKLALDVAIGASSEIKPEDHGKISDIVQRVKDLNSRLQDIRREQVFQRV